MSDSAGHAYEMYFNKIWTDPSGSGFVRPCPARQAIKSGEKFTPCKLIYRLVNPGKPNQPLTHAVNRIIAYLLYNKHVEVDRLGQDDKRKIIIYLSPRIKEGGYPCYVFCYQYYPEKERRKKC